MSGPSMSGPLTSGIDVAVVSPSDVVRGGLARMIGELPGLAVRGRFSSTTQLAPPPVGSPLAIVDVTRLRGAALTGSFWSMLPVRTRMVLVCRPGEPPLLPAAIRAGVRALILPDGAEQDLRMAFEAAVVDSVYVCPGLLDAMVGDAREPAVRLAGREIETLRLVAHGLTNPMIGERMGVTEATAETYIKRVRAKLNAANKAELTTRAIELGLLTRSEGERP